MKRLLSLLLAVLALAGCDQTMQRQDRVAANRITDAWPSGIADRDVPPHTVPLGETAWDNARSDKPKVTAALLRRGEDRYRIFCEPCHGFDGNGHGQVVQHGFPYPGNLNSKDARALAAQRMFDIITYGKGMMFNKRSMINPHDRWAIVAYVRALQLSQHARLADMPDVGETLP